MADFPFQPQDQNHFYLDDDDLLDTENLFSDPVIWQVCNDLTGNSPALNSAFLQPMAQYNCACCQILREITHTNGVNLKRLEIHGVFGIITHALLGIYDCGSSLQTQDCQMFDFQKESTVTVKNFLVEYYEVCRQEGYSPMQDPLSTFYEALSVGFNQPDNTPDFLQFTPAMTGDYQCEQLNEVGGSMKIPLSMQRERTRNLGLKDFVEYFHLPIEEAARRLNICPTVMKKICRKHGVLRWPHRKIKSIERKISKSEKVIEESAGEERARALEDIQQYKIQLNTIYAEFTK
ncbi:hypothetical protein AAHA92_28603 [Salvia divinorum]|uniref:RWP-RK domain-containing protein n=1 Tax=Salvia divinorum TaxID=28513 RepID=A0ABD1FW18_SALDI